MLRLSVGARTEPDCVSVCDRAVCCPAMEKMKRIKKRLSLTLRPSLTIDESLSELAEQMTIEDGGTKDNGRASTKTSTFYLPKRQKEKLLCI